MTAKRMGLSFAELNMMTMSDYADFVDMWVGGDPDGDTVREATQADIRNILG